jgi:hypothetical protein
MGIFQGLRPGVPRSVSTIAWAASALLCAAGCSFALDSGTKQCTTNTDCERFDGHPVCSMDGVCVSSGLGPKGCVLSPMGPSSQTDFLNQCTQSSFKEFDNCGRIGFCSEGQALPQATMAMTNKQGATVAPTAPMNLCTEGAPMSGTSFNIIYLYGSSDFGPLMRAAQPSLSAATTPYRAVFQNASSCQGVRSVFNPADTTAQMIDPPTETNGGWAFYFDAGGNQVNCRLTAFGQTKTPATVTIGISDLYSSTCKPPPNPAVTEYTGPVVPFVFAVKAASGQDSISTEAAHLLFGNGGKPPTGGAMKPAAPWIDYTKYSIRSNTAGSTVLTALLIGLDPAVQFWGIDRVSTDNLRDSLLAAPDPEAAIGILSIDFYDKNRGNLKALYLKSTGQTAGYLPDSTPTSLDKANVRDGHYPLWGYVHFIVPLDNTNSPGPAANAMSLLFAVDKLDQRLIDEIINASETPQCAMKVSRNAEIGPFTTRTKFACGCYFDFKTTQHTSCQPCTTSDTCPSDHPSCNYGYCELAATTNSGT